MACHRQGPKSPSESLWEEPTSSQSISIDRNGQHTAHCVFRERGFEPWPTRHLKHIHMEWYIFLNERRRLPGTWDCPVPGCDMRNGTFPDIITHLEECQHLKDSTTEYICPGCRTNVKMPDHTCPSCQAMGHGKKTMLKLKSSFESFLGHCSPRVRPSSTESSPISPLPPDLGPLQEKGQATPMPYAAVNTNFNARPPTTMSQHNRNVFPAINTQFNRMQIYAAGFNQSCISSTGTDSSFESGPYSIFSAQAVSSAASFPQCPWSSEKILSIKPTCLGSPSVSSWPSGSQPPCNAQHSEALSFDSGLSELPEHPCLQDMANVESMASGFLLDSTTNIDYSDVEKGIFAELAGLPQDQWIQPELFPFTHELPGNLPQEYCAAQELDTKADFTSDLSSPTSTDITMADTPPTSEGSSPSTSDSPLLECEECHWRPDNMKGKRNFKKLRLAVEKHVKRNHQSRDYECHVCKQSFRNRPDNVKPHIARKHPNVFEKLYPKTKHQDDGPQGEKARAPAAKPTGRKRASIPASSTSQASPTRGKLVRPQRG